MVSERNSHFWVNRLSGMGERNTSSLVVPTTHRALTIRFTTLWTNTRESFARLSFIFHTCPATTSIHTSCLGLPKYTLWYTYLAC